MKVLVLLAKGFETMEFSVFIDVMGWARVHFGCDVETVTCGLGKQVMSTLGIKEEHSCFVNIVKNGKRP